MRSGGTVNAAFSIRLAHKLIEELPAQAATLAQPRPWLAPLLASVTMLICMLACVGFYAIVSQLVRR